MAGRLHSAFFSLLTYPPAGYVFLSKDWYGATGFRNGIKPRNLLDSMIGLASYVGLPYKLLRAFSTPLFSPLPGVGLTIMNGILNLRSEKWMVVVEEALSSFLGINVDNKFFHHFVEDQLGKDCCKGILCFFEAAANSIRSTYDVSGFADKIHVIPPALPPLALSRTAWRLDKANERKRTTILVLGSANFSNQSGYFIKGMHIALKAYLNLRKEVPDVELIIHGEVPHKIKQKLNVYPDIFISNRLLNPAELSNLFLNSDIYLAPSFTTPWISYLEAMNYELPIVTINTNANSEVVEDGVNGFVAEVPKELEPIISNYCIPDRDTHRRIMHTWLNDNETIVKNVAHALKLLVEHPDLAAEMGRKGKEMLMEGGKFSIQRRNTLLKDVLDKAFI